MAFVVALALPMQANAHCDSLSGPVVQDARIALDKNDATPVLKWVPKKHEGEIAAAFRQTVAVRAKGKDARELADRFFFETLVRIHRQGEGAAFTGLKPANGIDPGVAEADTALQGGSVNELAKHMSSAVEAGIQKRFDNAFKLKKHAGESVEAGREYVAAYVDYIHFVESVHRLVAKGASHAHQGPEDH